MVDYSVVTWADALAAAAEVDFAQGVVQDILIRDEFSPAVPTIMFKGSKFEWAKEKTLGEDSADFQQSDDNLVATANSPIARVASEWEKVESRPVRFACYFGTDERVEGELTSLFSVDSMTQSGAVKRVNNAFLRRRWLVGGSMSNAENRFDSLPDLLDAEVYNAHIREGNLAGPGKQQTVLGTEEVTGIHHCVTDMDIMRFRIKTGPTHCFAMSSDDITDYEKVIRSQSGGMVPYQDFAVPGLQDVINTPVYKGIPLLRVDFIQDEGDGYGEWATSRRFYGFNLGSQESLKNLTSDTGAIRIINVGRSNETLLTDFRQLVLVVNQILPSLRSCVQCIHEV